MTLAADARYRVVTGPFVNNNQEGNEVVQLLAKPAGGIWSVVRTFAVGAENQQASWETALPVTAYDMAMRYLVASVPAVGYESSDPDEWTAPTAADSKSTVTTTSAPATGLAGSFNQSTGKLNLSWACAQLEVPFLLEKSVDGSSWSTVIADLVATSYQYTPSGGELNTSLYFRVTPRRGSVSGPVGSSVLLYMGVQVGTPTWIAGTFNNALPLNVALSWNAAQDALTYQIERSSNGGSSWSVIATVSTTTYNDAIDSSLTNKTLKYRLTGKNGSFTGSTSSVQDVDTTVVITSAVLLTAVQQGGAGSNRIAVTFTPASGPVQVQTVTNGPPTADPPPGTYGYTNEAAGASSASFFYNSPSGGEPAGPKPFTTRVIIQTVYPGGYVYSNYIDLVMAE